MSNYVVREVAPECINVMDYFDGDCFNENGGDFCYTIFPVTIDYHRPYCGLNADVYKELTKEIGYVLTEIDDLNNSWSAYKNVKEIMIDYKLPYNPRNAHILKGLIDSTSWDNSEVVSAYLTIKTGRKWDHKEMRGYCQGDYGELIYCKDFYTDENVREICDIYMGCCKEFCVVEIDGDGIEIDSCYGYFVADCQARDEMDYLKVVCDWAGVECQDATLELIENIRTVYVPTYKTYSLSA